MTIETTVPVSTEDLIKRKIAKLTGLPNPGEIIEGTVLTPGNIVARPSHQGTAILIYSAVDVFVSIAEKVGILKK